MRGFIFKILQLTLLFLIISANDAVAQEMLHQPISVRFEQIPLRKAIKILEKRLGIHFTHSFNKQTADQKVNLRVDKESLDTILQQLFSPINIQYQVYKKSDILLLYHPPKQGSSGQLDTSNILKTINGQIQDKNMAPLIGASVTIRDTILGTITDNNGIFSLVVKELPITLAISYIGYEEQEIQVNRFNAQGIQVIMAESSTTLDQVIVGAPRYTERILEAPVTIEKIEGITLQNSSAESVVDAFTNVKGVQVMKGSLSGAVMNTRGFSNMNNLRFLMHLDGMDVTTPSYGAYPSIGGVSSLDIQSAEIISGSSSALYGVNAFNGILLIKSKDPFLHQGVAAHLKTGITYQAVAGANPYNNFSFRIAKAVNKRFAFKIDYEGLVTKDWISNDYTQRNSNEDPLIAPDRHPQLTSPDLASYDAVNIGGDADGGILTQVFPTTTHQVMTSSGGIYDWNLGQLSRTGYKDKDILDNAISNHKVNVGLFYKINKDFRLEGLFKYSSQDFVRRHHNNSPFTNFNTHQQKLELKGRGWTTRIYTNFQNPKKAWLSSMAAAFIQKQLLSNADWGQRFVDAYYGEVEDIQSKSIQAARHYADAGMAVIGSNAFNEALDQSLDSLDFYTQHEVISSKISDRSWLWHTDVIYDFDHLIEDPSWGLSLGASYRRYILRSDGAYLNDNKSAQYTEFGLSEIGYKGNISIVESSLYGKFTKRIFDDRLQLSFIGRVNTHSLFHLNFNPQISAVFSPDTNKKHNIRASFSTGTRNPGVQESYMNLDVSPRYVVLGGIDDNLDHYVDPINQLTGADLRDAFKDQLGYEHKNLQPERNATFELGYKGFLVNEKLLIDGSVYYTTYNNFLHQIYLPIVVPTTGIVKGHSLSINSDNKVSSRGLGIGLEYLVNSKYKVYSNYQYANGQLSPSNRLAEYESASPAFNTPKNRFNIGINKRNTQGGLGFDVAARYASKWIFISPLSKGYIPELFTIDASISYRWQDFNFTLGASNLNRNEYRSVIGGPEIGSVYTLGILYNMDFN